MSSIKQAKSKAFKKGRKVGYWLAMQNIKKSKKLDKCCKKKGLWWKNDDIEIKELSKDEILDNEFDDY